MMYPWERVDPEFDSTLRLVHEAALRGHRVGIMNPGNLTIRNSETFGFVRIVAPEQKIPSSTESFYKKVVFRDELLPLSGFDAMFLRANPPVDNIMLNFLDSVKDDVYMINDIDGIRKANNKLYTASFHDPNNEIIPVTHVSKNKEYLKRVITESNGDKMILKPLDGFQGSGVIVLETRATQNINSLLDFYINTGQKSNYVILQEFIPGAEQGDVRVIMLNGKPIGAMKRVPAEGDARSNVHTGGTAVKHTLSKTEKRICEIVGPKLVNDGLYLAGLDIINGKLIEVNVLSPGGISRINKLNRAKLQQKIIDFVENIVAAKEAAITRRLAHRLTVQNA